MSSNPDRTLDAAKVETLRDHEWPPALTGMLSGLADGLNVYPIMAHHPALSRACANLREHLVNCSALAQDVLEIVILRTGPRLDAERDRSQPIERGRRRGFSDAGVASARAHLADLTGNDVPRCNAIGQLLDATRSAEETLEPIVHHFGKPAVSDSMATVGFCPTPGLRSNFFKAPIDQDIRAGLEAVPLDDALCDNCPNAGKGR